MGNMYLSLGQGEIPLGCVVVDPEFEISRAVITDYLLSRSDRYDACFPGSSVPIFWWIALE
jgi:hypothetical protein